MQVSEKDRHDLYEWAKATMGERRADTLMTYLPPVGWGDVATRRDLEVLEARLGTEFRVGLAELRAEMADRFRHQTNMLVSAIAALGGLVLAVGSVAVAAARYF